MKRNREGKSNAERFLTVHRTASQQLALSPGAAATNELSALHWDRPNWGASPSLDTREDTRDSPATTSFTRVSPAATFVQASVTESRVSLPPVKAAEHLMPIAHFLSNQAFDQKIIEAMSEALTDACHSLGLVDRTDQLTELVARYIIAHQDPLYIRALAQLKANPL